LRLDAVDKNLVVPYTEFLARLSAWVLILLGFSVASVGTMLTQSHFAVDIRRGCDGLVATMLLIAACLAYPLIWRERLLACFYGYTIIFGLNLLRIIGLFYLGVSGHRQTFEFFHTYVAQFVVIAVTMIFWVYWIGREKTTGA
jgi:exosortase H (IPTLxxWG-CTERM-specific)